MKCYECTQNLDGKIQRYLDNKTYCEQCSFKIQKRLYKTYNGTVIEVYLKEDEQDRNTFKFYRPNDTYAPGVYIKKKCKPSNIFPDGNRLEFFAWSDSVKDGLI